MPVRKSWENFDHKVAGDLFRSVMCLLWNWMFLPWYLTNRQIYGKTKASLWRNLSTGMPPIFFRTILCFVALVYNIDIFFRTAVLWNLFDIRFSYKHCNFLHVCLLVKMALKTLTRSIGWLVWLTNALPVFCISLSISTSETETPYPTNSNVLSKPVWSWFRVVTKGRGPRISPGYSEHGPRLLLSLN